MLLLFHPPVWVNVKLPEVTVVPLKAMPVKVTPFTVVVGTPVPPMLNAPTSVPVVSTSVLPEIVCGEPQTMAAASARSTPHGSSAAAIRIANPDFVAERIYIPPLSVLGCKKARYRTKSSAAGIKLIQSNLRANRQRSNLSKAWSRADKRSVKFSDARSRQKRWRCLGESREQIESKRKSA